MFFSQRKGLKPTQKALQLESVDDDLRYGLWSAVYEVILRNFEGPWDRWRTERTLRVFGSNLESLIRQYWLSLFKAPIDSIPILERENAGYRFVGMHITEITLPAEIAALEEGLKTYVKSAQQHLAAAGTSF